MHSSMRLWSALIAAALCVLSPATAWASSGDPISFTATGIGWTCVALFVIAYAVVIGEEFHHLRKSKPVIIAAGVIWALVAVAYNGVGDHTTASTLLKHNLLDYAELFLFLLAAMTYINTLEERQVFMALRSWLVSAGYSLRTLFWLTGVLAFFISAVADNLTTALLMAAVVTAVGAGHPTFIAIGCINLVVAANAGGAFSPFGDITTLMVWQQGIVKFHEFFDLFIPSLVNWLVPAIFMSFAIPRAQPHALHERFSVKQGGYVIIALFALTIALAVMSHHILHLPPVLGMMTGLGLLKVYGYRLRMAELQQAAPITGPADVGLHVDGAGWDAHFKPRHRPFDIFISLKRAEWDTLMFFYGVILCVGGLAALGYLAQLSDAMYGTLGPTWTNIAVGVISALVDNIPVMFAVLNMHPDMSLGQWLLVTLTAGVGGSMLSIGSAAGVALMGQARGVYTFFAHLKWTWAIALGYAASIGVHLWLNADIM